jgi:hypothetical protein
VCWKNKRGTLLFIPEENLENRLGLNINETTISYEETRRKAFPTTDFILLF